MNGPVDAALALSWRSITVNLGLGSAEPEHTPIVWLTYLKHQRTLFVIVHVLLQ